MDAAVSPTITKENLKKGVLAASALFALLALFMLEDHRTLIANASASLAAVLPTMSSSRGGPVPAPEKIATIPPVPLATVAVAAPTREAIAAAYQTALQGQPAEIRQPSAAQDGETLFKQFQAWEAAQNVKAQAARPAR
ncbi:MAG: hypothetical protein KGL35_31105 [Bradyrhizobium sp.]|nr:hypothetical protein [Bradyrhizobium sp.]